MDQCNLRKHMLLYCRDGQTVVFENYSASFIWVQYKGKIYRRSIDVLNKTLLFTDPLHRTQKPDAETLDDIDLSTAKRNKNEVLSSAKKTGKNGESITSKKSCMNCRFQRSGECFSSKVCKDYEPAYSVSKTERDQWPQYGDATLFKRHKK